MRAERQRRRQGPELLLWDEPSVSYEWDFGRGAKAVAVPLPASRRGLIRYERRIAAPPATVPPSRAPIYAVMLVALGMLAAIVVMAARPSGTRSNAVTVEPEPGVLAPAPRTPVTVAPPRRATPAPQPAPRPERVAPSSPRIAWQSSRSVGLPWAGRLVNGVRLPAEGPTFVTWDTVADRVPNPSWRRYGTDRLVRVLLAVLADYHRAHPLAPRVLVGDLSRPHGGSFGARYGGLGHVSHQNGLDVDVYYPRSDRRELAPDSPRQVDQRLAQDLVDRFVRAGAQYVFVGPNLQLTGPAGRVQQLVHHDDHLHLRIPPGLGRSTG